LVVYPAGASSLVYGFAKLRVQEKIRMGTSKKSKTEGPQEYVKRGLQEAEHHRYKAALRYYLKALDLAPDNAEVLFYVGFVYEDLRMLEAALTYYRRALKLAPTMVRAWEYSAVVHHKLRQYEEALECYERAIKLDPQYPYVYYNKGITLAAMGKLGEAIKYYDKTIRLDPKYGLAYINKGEKLNSLGRYDEAVKTFKKAVQYDKHERAYFGLGMALLALRRKKEALDAYQKGLKIDSRNAEAWKSAGEAAFQSKQFDVAASAYERSLELCPWDANLYYCIADSLRNQEKIKEARTYIRKGLQRYPSQENLDALLQALSIQEEKAPNI
jgi:tetratricopeptide (TPR) repeat protein